VARHGQGELGAAREGDRPLRSLGDLVGGRVLVAGVARPPALGACCAVQGGATVAGVDLDGGHHRPHPSVQHLPLHHRPARRPHMLGHPTECPTPVFHAARPAECPGCPSTPPVPRSVPAARPHPPSGRVSRLPVYAPPSGAVSPACLPRRPSGGVSRLPVRIALPTEGPAPVSARPGMPRPLPSILSAICTCRGAPVRPAVPACTRSGSRLGGLMLRSPVRGGPRSAASRLLPRRGLAAVSWRVGRGRGWPVRPVRRCR